MQMKGMLTNMTGFGEPAKDTCLWTYVQGNFCYPLLCYCFPLLCSSLVFLEWFGLRRTQPRVSASEEEWRDQLAAGFIFSETTTLDSSNLTWPLPANVEILFLLWNWSTSLRIDFDWFWLFFFFFFHLRIVDCFQDLIQTVSFQLENGDNRWRRKKPAYGPVEFAPWWAPPHLKLQESWAQWALSLCSLFLLLLIFISTFY